MQFIVYKTVLDKVDPKKKKKKNHGALSIKRYPTYTVKHEKVRC